MKKFVGVVVLMLGLTLAGCSQGGGNCGPVLQYCEPEETTTAPNQAGDEETLGAPGQAVPPGRAATDIVGDVTLVADIVGADGQYPGIGVSIVVEHTLVDKNDIPVVQDPYTKAWMPSPHGFDTNRTPVSYTVDILSDTESVKFTVKAVIEVGGTVTCFLAHAGVPIPGSARQATVITELGAGRGTADVDCVYIVGT